eukprot:SAG11_NODE_29014_length_315_cov_1.009259_1_plen_47_part_10
MMNIYHHDIYTIILTHTHPAQRGVLGRRRRSGRGGARLDGGDHDEGV